MLYFLYGTDSDKAREKAAALVASLQKKKPNAAVFKMDDENFEPAKLEEFIGGQGLFENRYIVLLSRVFENEEVKEIVLGKLKEIADSENIFIVREGALTKAEVEKAQKFASKTQEFKFNLKQGGGAKSHQDFNIFSLTDAFGRRDRKTLWVLYQKALLANVFPEEVHGILFWQIKAIAVAAESETSEEAEQKPFVFGKSKRMAANFASGEIGRLSSALVSIFHSARSGGPDLEIGLEKFILTI